jgi:Uma2 family endonuclease
MGQPPARPYTWTYSEYARFPDDGNRYEVLDGEVLVTPAPSPRHQRVAFDLAVQLDAYLQRQRLGLIMLDIDLLFASGHFLRPDLLFVPEDARDALSDRGMERAPGLIVEILSPTSGAIDRVKKPRRYRDFGVPEYWVVDPEEQVIWVWRFAEGQTDAERNSEPLTWQPAGATEALTFEIRDLFRPL